jgi:alpha-beta hydrolase superfamily lysophospholipase
MTVPSDDLQKSILDSPAISGSYLFPQQRFIEDPYRVQVGSVELACYRQFVDPDGYTLVHFHGNGEVVADYLPDMADVLASMGLNSLFVEYRQYGDSTGKAQLVAMLGDGAVAIAAAGVAPEKVIAFGRSIGSLYAIELVHRHPEIAGLIIESGIADPGERFLTYADLSAAGIDEDEVLAEVRRHFNHKKKLAGYLGPLLILHTERDGLVDISHAERNFKWSGSSQKQLVRFPLGDHNSIMAWNQQEYFAEIREFADALRTDPSPN